MDSGEKIRIVIADDHALMREGLRLILEQESDFVIIGTAEDGEQAVKVVKEILPDVVIIDVFMNGIDGIEAVSQIKKFNQNIKAISLTAFENPQYIDAIIESGADGFMLKTATHEEIKNAIRAVHNNLTVFDEKTLSGIREKAGSSGSKYTKRELQIIGGIVKGKTNKLIAAELNLTEGTVKNMVSNILSKAQVDSRTQLVTYVLQKMPELKYSGGNRD